MATYVLIHGASDSFFWHRVAPQLSDRGHEVVVPDLPSGDESATFADYTDVVVTSVVEAVGHRDDLIVVGQSMGAYTAPIVCQRLSVGLLVLVAPMIPAPGETAGEWWDNTGQPRAQRALDEREGRDPDAPFDVLTTFLHDVPEEVVAAVLDRGVPELADGIFGCPWPLAAWPEVPTRVLLGRDDRLFPLEFSRQVAQDRLGVTPDEMPGGHVMGLGHAEALVDWLESYRRDHEQAGLR